MFFRNMTNDKMILEFIWNFKGSQSSQNNFENNEQSRKTYFPI